MTAKFWAVIPAAGVGTRMGSEVPKQYLSLRGRTVLEHTVERFQTHPRIEGVVVAVAVRDTLWDKLPCAHMDKVRRAEGGAERCHSVLNALALLAEFAADDDWVLVHDAARPCLRAADIDRMLDTLARHRFGGILAVPVRDTIKRGDADGTITATIDRSGLWHAQTPQMFRLADLRGALERVLAAGRIVTDEAQAIELDGGQPVLVEGHVDNIKITQPQDMKLAELFLRQQEEERTCA